MATSTLIPPDRRTYFAVHPGVVPWEGTEIVPDLRWTTLSIFAADRVAVASGLSELIRNVRPDFGYISRIHLAPLPLARGKVLDRRILTELRRDPPAFRVTYADIIDGTFAISVADLDDVGQLDLAYLESYRTTALLAVAASKYDARSLAQRLVRITSNFGGLGIAKVLATFEQCCLIRVMTSESTTVAQVFTKEINSVLLRVVLTDLGYVNVDAAGLSVYHLPNS